MRAFAVVLAVSLLFAGANAFQLRGLLQAGTAAVKDAVNAVADGASNATKAVADAAKPSGAPAAQSTPAPAAPAAAPESSEPKNVDGRSGIYYVESPPVPAVTSEAPAADAGAAAPSANATAVAAAPPKIAGNNLMVVMTMGAASQPAVYQAQQELRSRVAQAAGVSPEKVLFFNQTGNVDRRTGQATMSLTLNVECGGDKACAAAGQSLYNPRNQANLTYALQQQGVTLLPNTTQVFGISGVGRYKGNQTLNEDFTIGTPKPKPAALPGMGLNSTLDPYAGLGLPGFNTSTAPMSTGLSTGMANFPGLNATLLPGYAGSPSVVTGAPTSVVDQSPLYPTSSVVGQQQGSVAGSPAAPARSSAAALVASPLLAVAGAAFLLL